MTDAVRYEARPDGIAVITIDRESRILSVNSSATRMFGSSASEMRGRSLTMPMPAAPRPGRGAVAATPSTPMAPRGCWDSSCHSHDAGDAPSSAES